MIDESVNNFCPGWAWAQSDPMKKTSETKQQKKNRDAPSFQIFIRQSLKRYNHISMNNTAQRTMKPNFDSQEDSLNFIPYVQEVKLLDTSSSKKKNNTSLHSDPIEQLLEEFDFWQSPYDHVQESQKNIYSQFEINPRQQWDKNQNGQETKKEVKRSVNTNVNKGEEGDQKARASSKIGKKIINKDYQKKSGLCFKKTRMAKTNKNLSKLLIRLYFKYRSVSKKNSTNNRLICKLNKGGLSNTQKEELRNLKKGLKKHNFQNASLQYLTKLFHDSQHNSLNRQFFRNVLSESEVIQKQILESSLIKNQNNRKEYMVGVKVMRLRMKSKQLACRIESC